MLNIISQVDSVLKHILFYMRIWTDVVFIVNMFKFKRVDIYVNLRLTNKTVIERKERAFCCRALFSLVTYMLLILTSFFLVSIVELLSPSDMDVELQIMATIMLVTSLLNFAIFMSLYIEFFLMGQRFLRVLEPNNKNCCKKIILLFVVIYTLHLQIAYFVPAWVYWSMAKRPDVETHCDLWLQNVNVAMMHLRDL